LASQFSSALLNEAIEGRTSLVGRTSAEKLRAEAARQPSRLIAAGASGSFVAQQATLEGIDAITG
jgi:hypothetical protein